VAALWKNVWGARPISDSLACPLQLPNDRMIPLAFTPPKLLGLHVILHLLYRFSTQHG